MAKSTSKNGILLSVIVFSCFQLGHSFYNVKSFGANPDGVTDSTKAFQMAWAKACRSKGFITLYVPVGRYLVRRLEFEGPCTTRAIKLLIDGTLVAPSNYLALSSSAQWIGFNNVDRLSIVGGTIDGQGWDLWQCKAKSNYCPLGTTSLTVSHSSNVEITDLKSINSELFHMAFYGVTGLSIRAVQLIAPENSPNTDGIHIQGCQDVTITHSLISTGDDCISIGPGTTNVWIERISCGPGHGISIGSLGNNYNEPGVTNVTVTTTVFTGTQNGLRIKTWGRPSSGFVKGVVFQHAVMRNVQNPIAIDQNYCPGISGCPTQDSGIKISDITYSDVRGTSASKVAVNLDCSPSNPCNAITLQDVKLTYGHKIALSSCKYVVGTAEGVSPKNCLKN